MNIKLKFLLLVCALFFSVNSVARVVKYDLNIEKKSVNLSGNKEVDFALMVNGSIPAPTLEFTEGDEAEITVYNKLSDKQVSIHWHGILLPPIMDGVPYINTPPIYPGESFTFKFKIRQHGTYWYHSHTALQEQKGVYGALIIHPKKKTIKADKDLVVVLSDWSDENADNIMKNLRKDGDYYQYKKDSVRSYWGAIKEQSLGSHLSNEWMRMAGMDLSDVGYDAFLMNGKKDSQLLMAHPGERIRIRIINAGASSYFYVSLGDSPMKVISADGIDIKPIFANELLMGMAETYDILFTVPEHKNYELRATSQDISGFTSGWIGMGEKVLAREKQRPNLYSGMDHGEHESHMNHDQSMSEMSHEHHMGSEKSTEAEGHSNHKSHNMMKSQKLETHHDMSEAHKSNDKNSHHHGVHGNEDKQEEKQNDSVVETLTVDHLSSKIPTHFSKDKKIYDLKLVLGGDMERYVWHINGKAIHQDRNINVNEGDVVRFTFENETMMHHPMHLHGHFFRVLNESGKFSPLKHTVDVSPHSSRTIEFYADEPGQWMLHCHNLYHMKNGMARVIKYSSYKPTGIMAEYDKKDPHLKEHKYFSGMLSAGTSHSEAKFQVSRTWDALEASVEMSDYNNLDHVESDLFYKRWFSKFFNVIVGGTYYGEYDKNNTRGVLGIGYTLPLMIETHLLVDHRGEFRLDLEKKFQWTKYIFSDAEVTFRQNQDMEYELTLMYANSWAWAVGLMYADDEIGISAKYKF